MTQPKSTAELLCDAMKLFNLIAELTEDSVKHRHDGLSAVSSLLVPNRFNSLRCYSTESAARSAYTFNESVS